LYIYVYMYIHQYVYIYLYIYVQKNPVSIPPIIMDLCGAFGTTEWRRCIECLKLQVISRKRATNSRALLQKMTCKDKASYGSSPPCTQSGGRTRIAKPRETSLYLCKRALHIRRGGGLGSRPKKMYGERLGDGVEYHLMKPTPRR